MIYKYWLYSVIFLMASLGHTSPQLGPQKGYLVCDEHIGKGIKILPYALGQRPSKDQAMDLCQAPVLGYAEFDFSSRNSLDEYKPGSCTDMLIVCRFKENGEEIGTLMNRKKKGGMCKGVSTDVGWPADRADQFCSPENEDFLWLSVRSF